MEGTPAIDRPRAVRAGEELDLAALRRFLQERGLGPARSEDGASPLTVE